MTIERMFQKIQMRVNKDRVQHEREEREQCNHDIDHDPRCPLSTLQQIVDAASSARCVRCLQRDLFELRRKFDDYWPEGFRPDVYIAIDAQLEEIVDSVDEAVRVNVEAVCFFHRRARERVH